MEVTQLPPGRYFISHSYRDSAELDRLLVALPPYARPFIFPAIAVRPDEFVSTPVLDAVAACDGLIALGGADFEESFWVMLEKSSPNGTTSPSTRGTRRVGH